MCQWALATRALATGINGSVGSEPNISKLKRIHSRDRAWVKPICAFVTASDQSLNDCYALLKKPVEDKSNGYEPLPRIPWEDTNH